MTHQTAGFEPALDERKTDAARWAAESLGLPAVELSPVSGDASFRRYFRFNDGPRSIILMDAPPEKEDSAAFIDIADRIRSANLNAPEILCFDLDSGFGLLEDFGDTLYRELINEQSVAGIFPQLFVLLEGMATRVDAVGLPAYSAGLLQQELDLFSTWYLGVHNKRPLKGSEESLWSGVCTKLIESALEQPRVFVHKDFHSCNLLHTPGGPGIIDFQDGVRGPVSYDFVSLIWDRYIAWPRAKIESWMRDVHALLRLGCSLEEWVRWCDLMGLQRNLKIVGIFARLKYRDGKDGYLEMIPRFYQYLMDVLPFYPEFREFNHLLEQIECAP
jgi:aminoglycoside/choline kinase family phosphotransferase